MSGGERLVPGTQENPGLAALEGREGEKEEGEEVERGNVSMIDR